MIDLDRIEESCDSLIKQGFGWNNPACTSASAVKEIITRLRQAEKDAARYRWLRDESAALEVNAPLVFNADEFGTPSTIIDGDHLDVAVDEAMKCSK